MDVILPFIQALLWPGVIASALFIAYRLGTRALDASKVEADHVDKLNGITHDQAEMDTRFTYECSQLRSKLAEIEDRVKTDSSFRAMVPKRPR